MHIYRLTISYDGTRYRGWQRQMNTDNTIQRIVEWTLGKILGYNIRISGAGRTDSGVHAFAQEASIVVDRELDTAFVWNALNRQLPEDIRIIGFTEMNGYFHARKSASAKCYEYYIDTREKADVFTRRYCFHFPRKLNVDVMKEAAGLLVGTHNFQSFTDLKESTDTIRTIYGINISEDGDKIKFTFIGEGFLYHMVRILTGTLLEVGTGEKYPSQIPVIIAAMDRSWSGFPAPARGLFLKKVYYDDSWKSEICGYNTEEREEDR